MKLADGTSVLVNQIMAAWWLDSETGEITAAHGTVIASRRLSMVVYDRKGYMTGRQSVSLKEIYATRRGALEAALADEVAKEAK